MIVLNTISARELSEALIEATNKLDKSSRYHSITIDRIGSAFITYPDDTITDSTSFMVTRDND